MKKLNSLSVFFPCFNEAANLPLLIEQAQKEVPKLAKKYELIIVNDGSSDDTLEVAAALQKKYPQLRLVSHQQNLGYGEALATGFQESRFDWIFFTDGDNQFDLSELAEFIPYAGQYQVVIGYRKNRAEGWTRQIYAEILKLFVKLVFRLHVKDVDCAFKLFKAEVIKPLELISTGGFVSSEFLYRLKKQGIEFKQLPVTHLPRQFGTPTGNSLRVLVKAGWDALRLYFKLKLGLGAGCRIDLKGSKASVGVDQKKDVGTSQAVKSKVSSRVTDQVRLLTKQKPVRKPAKKDLS
ncbi:MAG: glycosyltransferase [Candidatus Pacebacteria bacterium]|nr:glycosyltransferase [Candidatus Paceibacterota bacterium]